MEVLLEKEGVKYKYSCLMWYVPQFYEELILAWGKNNIPESAIYNDPEDPGSSGREDEVHLTIKYGIHTKNPQEVADVVSGFGQFPVEFGAVSKFPGDGYEVLKIEVDGERLRELNALVTSQLECTDTYPTYKPHITLAYIKPGSCDHLLEKPIFKELSVTATELILSVAKPEEGKEKFTIEIV
jgi:2'-5' RNA ligase